MFSITYNHLEHIRSLTHMETSGQLSNILRVFEAALGFNSPFQVFLNITLFRIAGKFKIVRKLYFSSRWDKSRSPYQSKENAN